MELLTVVELKTSQYLDTALLNGRSARGRNEMTRLQGDVKIFENTGSLFVLVLTYLVVIYGEDVLFEHRSVVFFARAFAPERSGVASGEPAGKAPTPGAYMRSSIPSYGPERYEPTNTDPETAALSPKASANTTHALGPLATQHLWSRTGHGPPTPSDMRRVRLVVPQV
ncbi:hypothetical protein TcasGA2_TC007118 [Tribolium castaneum]|uniref:Uncharacterized protein n=1 Tax=Tribolium castaneum TaxID=7070 RepID=D2A1B0_TRICA|nr:hypothetical protein TcasGA2_TC007118 [Tribolium castaneum]